MNHDRHIDVNYMKNILVVDDNIFICRKLERYLREGGYSLSCARDFDSAKTVMENEDFDLYLIDLILFDKSGLKLVERIRELGKRGSVIIITAHAKESNLVSAIKLRAYDYITKPIYKQELIDIVEQALRKNLKEGIH